MSVSDNALKISERLTVILAMSEALQRELHQPEVIKTPLLDSVNAGIYISQTFEVPWVVAQSAKDFADILVFITGSKNSFDLAQEMLAELKILMQTPPRPMDILAMELVALTLTASSMFLTPQPLTVGSSRLHK